MYSLRVSKIKSALYIYIYIKTLVVLLLSRSSWDTLKMCLDRANFSKTVGFSSSFLIVVVVLV